MNGRSPSLSALYLRSRHCSTLSSRAAKPGSSNHALAELETAELTLRTDFLERQIRQLAQRVCLLRHDLVFAI